MTRVLIVDDSLTVRMTVSDRLKAAGFDVVGAATDGLEAVAMTHDLRPDVVLMDVVMPQVDGLAATRRIMEETPTPVVILSSHASQQEVFKTYDALAAGALEVCTKPTADGWADERHWEDILMTVAAAAQVKATRLVRSQSVSRVEWRDEQKEATGSVAESAWQAVCIGASTGGPKAIRTLLGGLPPSYPLPIMVAMHCNRRLCSSIAGWLDRECSIRVKEAIHGEPLPKGPGVVVTAPAGQNLTICRGQFVLSEPGPSDPYVPSVDRLAISAARHYGDKLIGVLLTGMGTDGAQGMKEIKEHGGCTVVQDEETSVVFGMPAAAIAMGAADHVAPLQEIPELLVRLAATSGVVGRKSEAHS